MIFRPSPSAMNDDRSVPAVDPYIERRFALACALSSLHSRGITPIKFVNIKSKCATNVKCSQIWAQGPKYGPKIVFVHQYNATQEFPSHLRLMDGFSFPTNMDSRHFLCTNPFPAPLTLISIFIGMPGCSSRKCFDIADFVTSPEV